MSIYRDQLEAWLKMIDVKADMVLDVGGGQLPIKNRVKSFEAKEYFILDNAAEFKPDFFADLNRDITFGEKQGGGYWLENDDYLYPSSKPAKADIVFCLEVFEYIWNPVQALKNIYSMLDNDRGIAYLSFPTQYPLHAPAGTDCLRYMKPGIEKLLGEVGFEYWEITPRLATNGLDSLVSFYREEGMHPLKGSREVIDIGYMVKAFKKKA